ncbi:glycosyltransferase family 4 protein [Halococcus agarilyticus]|uniref:glycosyltransferase family 4 protein n=1 Tax=Halococcus agarilyticus TaxID=1232219 RepID=UPI000677EFD8|nr:glycosyltransferase family 4 protein [Halococcus agarilyticus]
MGRTKLYPVGSGRLEKIAPALRRAFDVVEPGRDPVPRSLRAVPGLGQAGTLVEYLGPIVSAPAVDGEKPVVLVDSVGLFPLLVGILCEQRDVPFVVRLRGGMWKEFRDRAHTESHLRRHSHNLHKEFVRNRVLSLADRILPVSPFLRAQVAYELEVDLERVRVVHNPLETDRFDATPEGRFKRAIGLDDEKFISAITSFNYRRKYEGIVHFVPAIQRVLEAHSDWHFVIAGAGTAYEEGRERIRERFDEPVRDRVVFTGFYTPIEELLVDADIALHLSFRDAGPMAVLEAQAARTPIVVNTGGGMAGLLDRSVRGTAVVENDDELYHSLNEFVEEPERRRAVGERNRRHIEREFAPETVAAEFRHAIDDMLS